MMEEINNRHAEKGTFNSTFKETEAERLLTRRSRELNEEIRKRYVSTVTNWVPIAMSTLALVVSLIALYRS